MVELRGRPKGTTSKFSRQELYLIEREFDKLYTEGIKAVAQYMNLSVSLGGDVNVKEWIDESIVTLNVYELIRMKCERERLSYRRTNHRRTDG